MSRQARAWKEEMNRGSNREVHKEEEKPQKELNDFIEEEKEDEMP